MSTLYDPLFWGRTKPVESGCIEWQGFRLTNGYGRVGRDGFTWLAHRYAWTITNGAIPAGLLVCHTCDNRKCVNPAHLFLGTHQENIDDAKSKGRMRPGDPRKNPNWRPGRRFGLDNPSSKLKPSDFPEIVALRAQGLRQKDIAAKFGITQVRVSQILRRGNVDHGAN